MWVVPPCWSFIKLPPPSHGFNIYFVYYLAKDGENYPLPPMVSIYIIWLKMEMELPPPSHGFNIYFVYYLAKDGDGITPSLPWFQYILCLLFGERWRWNYK